MQTEVKEPLYKRLDKERTQGDWVVSKNKQVIYAGVVSVANTYGHMQDQNNNIANAEYTVLAVNNLHLIADVLSEMIASYEKERGLLHISYLHPYYVKAKEALSKII